MNVQIQDILNHAYTLNPTDRAALQAALIGAAAKLDIPPPPATSDTASRPLQPGSPFVRFPRIGGPGLVVQPSVIVDTPGFLDRWAPSGIVVWVYVLGCEGLTDLAKLLGLPLFKPGSTEGDIRDRMIELGADQYGSMWRSAGALTFSRGFKTWISEQLPITLQFSSNSPVLPGVRAIRVRLPVGMSAKRFDNLLSAEVRKADLANLARTSKGAAYCKARGIDPAQLRRFTSYEFGAGARLSAATEFAVFRPRLEADRLAVIAEKIIVDFVIKQLP